MQRSHTIYNAIEVYCEKYNETWYTYGGTAIYCHGCHFEFRSVLEVGRGETF